MHETATGSVRVIDFMPPRGEAPDIVRIVEGLDGEVRDAVGARDPVRLRRHRAVGARRRRGRWSAVAGPDALCLRTPVEVRGEDLTTVSEFTVRPGERIPFVLTWFPSHLPMPAAIDAEQALTDAEDYWLEWADRCGHHGDYHDEIHQSLLVLKALTYDPTGGIVAAPTTSLPEHIGGPRNWDYRFCWLRDAALTLVAMLNGGYVDEARAWRSWLLRAVAGDPADLQIMYGIGGERRLDERVLEWLPGFEGSVPVRVGNAASTQLQLDVYGEVLDAAYQTLVRGVDHDEMAWSLTRVLLRWLEEGWRQKDAGIWEVRGPARHFTHSKVMSWVAFDRAVRMHEEFAAPGPVERWRELRAEIHAEVLARGWSDEKQSFTQSYDSDDLDASALLMASVGFLDAADPRFASTVEAVRRELTVDGLVLRYVPRVDGEVDGIEAGEGVFLPCSFWLADALALQGRHTEARELFERLLDLRNDVGLLSEEYDPVERRLLGNFPQAFTHLALVNTALVLGRGRDLRQA